MISSRNDDTRSNKVQHLGLSEIELLNDFPIITAAYGFSRSEKNPNNARLNPFPPDTRRGGRFPIIVDKVQADAIRLRINQEYVIGWIKANGFNVNFPEGTD